MATQTTNLQLTKPAYGEAADIAVINTNMDTIDTAVAGKVTAPSSTVTANTVAVFDGTTGKLIKSSGLTIGKSVPSNAVFTDNDTKNTAGTTNTTSKIFLAGATSQAANPQTYSNVNCYASGGKLYSNGKEVVNLSNSQALTNKTYNGYTLGPACAKDVDTAVTAGSSKLPTSDAVASALSGKIDAGRLLSIDFWQEGQFSLGTWIGPWDFDQIVTIRSRSSQNLTVEVTWEGDTGNFYTVAQHWDNNHGDGISSVTIVVPQGRFIRIWQNGSRDTDTNSRWTKYRLKA